MNPQSELDGRLLVLFDGHCVLCNRGVRWLFKRDRHARLRFTDFDSPVVAAILARHGLDAPAFASNPATILVVRDPGGPQETLRDRSSAILVLLAELPRPWPQIAAAAACIPRPLRDLAYRLVARWRYRIWGRVELCPLPSPADRQRHL